MLRYHARKATKRDALKFKEGKRKSVSVGFRRLMNSVLIARLKHFQQYQ